MYEKRVLYQKFGKNCFQLTETYTFETRIKTGNPFTMPFSSYDGQGIFTLYPGFCWDGPSDPVDPFEPTISTMRCSAEHDAKYRAMREGLISTQWRDTADQELRDVGIQDGMSEIRAEAFYLAVRDFGAGNATGGNPIKEAP